MQSQSRVQPTGDKDQHAPHKKQSVTTLAADLRTAVAAKELYGRVIFGMLALYALTLLAVGGVCFVAVNSAKETHVNANSLVGLNGDTVAVNVAQSWNTLEDLVNDDFSPDELDKVRNVGFMATRARDQKEFSMRFTIEDYQQSAGFLRLTNSNGHLDIKAGTGSLPVVNATAMWLGELYHVQPNDITDANDDHGRQLQSYFTDAHGRQRRRRRQFMGGGTGQVSRYR